MAYEVINGKLRKVKKNKPRDYDKEWSKMHESAKKQVEIMDRIHERERIDRLGTRERHEAMIDLAKRNERKGKKGGDCNVTQCQKPGASSYNTAMRAYYCESCAHDIWQAGQRDGRDFIRPTPDYTYKYEG
ncbi:hypothetical protein KVP40.0105 [Vibrio phage KVP40]|uniref:Uncharacterized protein n=3 Tax=Schizotequatrovirus KVP40 TaxID=1914019 RepID=Q6WI47_BPKVM|nr:hypothetical protein KVP40.0105 [Vibrio phage KVP40]AAQ64176.1 hypothetical protein KVP40.0105 [Vibrio phage KVP40]AFN37334.1 hypothetical protein pp2_101 [Vibrio phage phi-pp2]QIW90930.1 hypothetical protein COHAPHLL_00067 [Vibrio phage V09]WOL25015.1 hypothetical protein [Vibrio phage PG216]